MADDSMALGYALGQDSGGGNGGFGGFDGGLWAVIILAMIFGNNGWGGGFGGAGMNGALTRAELYDGFAIQNIDSAVRGVQQGICDSTYALNNTLMSGFHGVDNAICNLGYQTQSGFNSLSHQISDCCCTTQRAIDGVRYDMATQACDTRRTVTDVGRDINDTIRDGFARMEAQANARYTAELERKLNACDRDSALQGLSTYLINTLRPSPIPAYPSCNPWAGVGGNWSGCNCGC